MRTITRSLVCTKWGTSLVTRNARSEIIMTSGLSDKLRFTWKINKHGLQWEEFIEDVVKFKCPCRALQGCNGLKH